MSATWIVERTVSRRFPFRISIEQDGRLILAVRAQARWPGPGQQIFCLRERELDPAESLEPMERVPVTILPELVERSPWFWTEHCDVPAGPLTISATAGGASGAMTLELDLLGGRIWKRDIRLAR